MITSSCYCIMLRKATRRVSSIYDEALAPVGINIAQFSLLKNITRRAPISLTELGTVMELDRSTVGRNTKLLERMKLVETLAGKDSREALLSLTGAGKETLEKAIPLWETAQQSISKKLGCTNGQFQEILSSL